MSDSAPADMTIGELAWRHSMRDELREARTMPRLSHSQLYQLRVSRARVRGKRLLEQGALRVLGYK